MSLYQVDGDAPHGFAELRSHSRSARLRRAPLHGLRAFGTSPMRGCGPSPLRRDPLGPGSGGSPQGWAGSGSRPRSGAPGPLPRGGPACAVRGAPVPGAGAPRATRPAPLASVVCGRSPGAPACGRGRRGPLFGHSPLAAPARCLLPRPRPGLARRAWPPVGLPRRCPPRLHRSPPCGLVPAASGGCARRARSGWPAVAPVRAPGGRPSSAPAGRPSSGPLAGSPPPAASACRAGSRPNGGRFGRPPPPRGFGGPPVPPLGGPGPRLCGAAPRGFLRCGAARRLAACAGAPAGAACFSWGCCQSGASPLLPPRSPSPAGGGGGHRARRVASPQRGPLFAGLSGPPGPIRALPGWGCASPVDFPKIVNRPAAHDCERAVKGK